MFQLIENTTRGFQPLNIRTATMQDEAKFVELLTSAFESIDIPNSINFIVQSKGDKAKRKRLLMKYLFQKAIRSGLALISEDERCVMLMTFPHQNRFTLSALWWQVKLFFGCIGLLRLPIVLRREKIIKYYHGDLPHIHPLIIAVKPEDQRKGIAIKFIQSLCIDRSKQALPVILETTTSENLRLYKRLGFSVIGKSDELGYPLYFLRNYQK